MKRLNKFVILTAMALAATSALADRSPIYTLAEPTATRLFVAKDPSTPIDDELAEWAASNACVAVQASCYDLGVVSSNGVATIGREKDPAKPGRRTDSVIAGFPLERNKPAYFLGDRLDEPDGVDWAETYAAFVANAAITNNFLFDTNNHAVYVTLGVTSRFPWVLRGPDGAIITNEVAVIASPAAGGRPKNIFWTDSTYGGRPVDLTGKFVKFFGPEEILTKVMREEPTGTIVNGEMSTREVVASGLYVEEGGGKKKLYAAGEIEGQVVMAYYDSGNYDRIVDVQAIEVSRPQVVVRHSSVGSELQPSGRGYNIDGLLASPTTLSDFDEKGPFLYQHKGLHPYSPKNGSVFALRPSDDKTRNQTQIYWMESDRQGVDWPFEVNEYLVSWPRNAAKFVRGSTTNPGKGIVIPSDYTANLMKWQEDLGVVENHAREVSNREFITYGPGYSLLKLTANDNIWFLPVESILRTDESWYDLSLTTLVRVGDEVELRGGSVSGLVEGRTLEVDPEVPGYIYVPESDQVWNAGIYDETGTCADGLKSVVYPVTAAMTNDKAFKLEVWWSSSVMMKDMPAELHVPSLPQVYTVDWPKAYEAPQIVLASQLGSESYSTYCDGAAMVFDGENAFVKLPKRRFFNKEKGGAIGFWTRPYDESAVGKDSALATFASTNNTELVSVFIEGTNFVATVGTNRLEIAGADTGDWRYLSLSWDNRMAVFSVYDGRNTNGDAKTCEISSDILAELGEQLGHAYIGAMALSDKKTCPRREIDEFQTWNRLLSLQNLEERALKWATGHEVGLTFFLPILNDKSDLEPDGRDNIRYVRDLVLDIKCLTVDCLRDEPGAPHLATTVFSTKAKARIYRQNDSTQVGYNPNEEHAFVRAGDDADVVWALRCDLNNPGGKTKVKPVSEPAVLVEYVEENKRKMQFFHVVVTNNHYSALSDVCTVGLQLPGPKPLTLFDRPWLKETYWDSAAIPPFRDRKGQVWARAEGEFDIFMYYAQQSTFDWPDGLKTPEIGDAVPWLAYLTDDGERPEPWHWLVEWPDEAPELKLTQMLTTAENGLPEMWNAQSMAVLYPTENADAVVMLSDPTVARGADLGFKASQLGDVGLRVGPGEKLLEKKGLYYFQGVSPSLSQRLYIDPSTDRLMLKGVKESNPGGVELLYVNVLSKHDVDSIEALVADASSQDLRAKFVAALHALGNLGPVEPTTLSTVARDGVVQAVATYEAPDHYALTAMGMTNWVVVIENDATNKFCNAGNPINMHVIKVVPEYYTGRVVTREDPHNLLSQVLGIHYSDSIAGHADEYVFDWRKAFPKADGTVPSEYDDEDIYLPQFSEDDGVGLTSFSIGEQGDTLANLVNSYYVCRYRAKDENSPAWKVMGDKWSDWITPPALAEGWVQRVLNNITPFTQRMTDLYENEAETAVTWMQQAGKPYTGDVALNQENLTSVGLIELYRTILNKAETMSLMLEINDPNANKQLLLAVERLADLYTVLGDEAYSDAANPTIGFGSNFGEVETGLQIDYGAASSSLFAFDNQVPTLLDEELALLRGRSCVNAPGNTIGPYYNRLVWNFTKGITAGEVAYAVNYNISGRKTSTLTASTAAELYPQGHGDAYGHYLSALQGWYRLLRNPYFSWGVVAMGEMNVADNVVNVDYYDEAKFAEAAASVARTAARTTELTALKHYRDNSADSVGGGYLDSNEDNAFGYGEWASRGTYGALCNWAVANSLLPEEAKTNEMGVAYADKGLLHIDRGTVSGLAEMVAAVGSIQETIDRLDAGQNPLGLDENAIPFDLTPLGSSKEATHFEQIRERAVGAFDNAKKILDRAQEYSNRLRMIDEARAGMVDNLDDMESDLTAQLIAIYGRPYSDDIGPGKTYKQDYDGPDLYHYMWMDLAAYGFDSVEDTLEQRKLTYRIKAYNENGEISAVSDGEIEESYLGTLSYSLSSRGLVLKPEDVKGERPATGELQLAYADFLNAYGNLLGSISAYNRCLSTYSIEHELASAEAAAAAKLSSTVADVYTDGDTLKSYVEEIARHQKALTAFRNTVDVLKMLLGAGSSITGNVGLSTTLECDASDLVTATEIIGALTAVFDGVIAGLEGGIAEAESELEKLRIELEKAEHDYSHVSARISNWERLVPAIDALSASIGQMEGALSEVQSKQDAVLALIEKGNSLLSKRELQRQQAVNNIAKMRYNDMFFRKLRNETLSKYDVAFRQAQTYAFLAAKAYCYETGSSMEDGTAGGELIRQILGARALGETDANGKPIVSANGDAGLAGALAKMDANWAVAKTQLGLNNPQPYATWFSLRHGLFRILGDETGDDAWKTELSKYWVDDIRTQGDFVRHCQPFASQFGLADQEPGLIIPFETTVDFAKNLFGNDLAFDDAQFDSSWFATKIAAAGVWFEGYNEKREGYKGQSAFATTPNVYLVPVGTDKMRAPGADGEEVVDFEVVDQTIPVPHPLTAAEIAEANRLPLYTDGEFGGVDAVTRIRRHPSFRAYYGKSGESPNDSQLDATRLVGRSVWNTKWMLVIPAGTLNADREAALSVFIHGLDTDRDGVLDIKPVRDIRIGFKTYSHSGK